MTLPNRSVPRVRMALLTYEQKRDHIRTLIGTFLQGNKLATQIRVWSLKHATEFSFKLLKDGNGVRYTSSLDFYEAETPEGFTSYERLDDTVLEGIEYWAGKDFELPLNATISLVKASRDVSDRKAAILALREMDDMLRALGSSLRQEVGKKRSVPRKDGSVAGYLDVKLGNESVEAALERLSMLP